MLTVVTYSVSTMAVGSNLVLVATSTLAGGLSLHSSEVHVLACDPSTATPKQLALDPTSTPACFGTLP